MSASDDPGDIRGVSGKRRKRRNTLLLVLVAGLLLFGAAAGGLLYALRPATLRSAVGPPGSD
ncbi:MAG TPA: TRAP transporter substrate-binding protein, partial [Xanthobacteraceae bacterium]